MSDLSPRPSYTPRRVREQRAYRLAVTGGIAAVIAVLGLIATIVGAVTAGLPVVAAIVAIVCFIAFRRMVSPGR
jgi:hypothetical protein